MPRPLILLAIAAALPAVEDWYERRIEGPYEPSEYNRRYGYTGVASGWDLRLRGSTMPGIGDYRIDDVSVVDRDDDGKGFFGGQSAELRLSYTRMNYDTGWHVGFVFIPYRTHELEDASTTVIAGGLDAGLSWRLGNHFELEFGPFVDVGVSEMEFDNDAGLDLGSGTYFACGARLGLVWFLDHHWHLVGEVGYLSATADGTFRFTGVPGTSDTDLYANAVIAGAALGYRF